MYFWFLWEAFRFSWLFLFYSEEWKNSPSKFQLYFSESCQRQLMYDTDKSTQTVQLRQSPTVSHMKSQTNPVLVVPLTSSDLESLRESDDGSEDLFNDAEENNQPFSQMSSIWTRYWHLNHTFYILNLDSEELKVNGHNWTFIQVYL